MLQGREQTACSLLALNVTRGWGCSGTQSDSNLSCLGLFYFYCGFFFFPTPFCFVLFLGSALRELLRQTWICRMSRAAGRGTAGIRGWLRWVWGLHCCERCALHSSCASPLCLAA